MSAASATIVIGVVGGVIGGWLFSLAGEEGIGDFGLRSMFVAFVGAVVLLVIVGLFTAAATAAAADQPASTALRRGVGRACIRTSNRG